MAPRASSSVDGYPQVADALADCRKAFWSVALFTAIFNVMMLAGPIYMLQVYDRVLTSRSVATLIALSVLLIAAYLFQGALDLIRSRIVVRISALLDQHLSKTVHGAMVRLSLSSRQASDAAQPVRDLDQVRSFLTSGGPAAIIDMPWAPIFLFICYLIHPWLGYAALAGALVLFSLTLLTERSSRAPSRALSKETGVRSAIMESDRRNSESLAAMGMGGTLANRWFDANGRFVDAMGRSSDIVSSYGSVSKVIRLLLQSIMLGLGAYLVIRNELTPGGMIASSIMMGRALAPIETAIANWRGFISARQSIKRLSELLSRMPPDRNQTDLPAPARSLVVEGLLVAAPGGRTPIVQNIGFDLVAGDAMGVIGPSGAGKTSLIRALVGVWRPSRGTVRLDGATLDQWQQEKLGRHIGFVSQAIELFDGTVAQNIARMAATPDDAAVLAAARAAGAHDLILGLPNGYDTEIGDAGTALSAGQRQRVALARAFYGNPFLLVLDEPNANLDSEGEQALQQAISGARARGAIVVIIAHRPSALSVCNKVLLIQNGTQQAFGPRDEVLKKLIAPAADVKPAAAGATPLKVVREASAGGER